MEPEMPSQLQFVESSNISVFKNMVYCTLDYISNLYSFLKALLMPLWNICKTSN